MLSFSCFFIIYSLFYTQCNYNCLKRIEILGHKLLVQSKQGCLTIQTLRTNSAAALFIVPSAMDVKNFFLAQSNIIADINSAITNKNTADVQHQRYFTVLYYAFKFAIAAATSAAPYT